MLINELERPVVLLGNGINRFASSIAGESSEYLTWENLLQQLAQTVSSDRSKLVDDDLCVRELMNSGGITMPELYTAFASRDLGDKNGNETSTELETILSLFRNSAWASRPDDDTSNWLRKVEHYKDRDRMFKSMIAREISLWKPNPAVHGAIVDALQHRNIPVLTTNYDALLENSCDLSPFEEVNGFVTPSVSRKYTSKIYWAESPKTRSKLQGFAIWHIHGHVMFPSSIKISNDDYADLLSNYKEHLKSAEWMELFLNRNLVIAGLSLDVSEYPLRWLLWRRAMSQTNFGTKIKTIYMTRKNDRGRCADADLTRWKAKRFFLESMGASIIEYETYEDLYSDLGM